MRETRVQIPVAARDFSGQMPDPRSIQPYLNGYQSLLTGKEKAAEKGTGYPTPYAMAQDNVNLYSPSPTPCVVYGTHLYLFLPLHPYALLLKKIKK